MANPKRGPVTRKNLDEIVILVKTGRLPHILIYICLGAPFVYQPLGHPFAFCAVVRSLNSFTFWKTFWKANNWAQSTHFVSQKLIGLSYFFPMSVSDGPSGSPVASPSLQILP